MPINNKTANIIFAVLFADLSKRNLITNTININSAGMDARIHRSGVVPILKNGKSIKDKNVM